VPLASVQKFKAYSAKRMKELMTPWNPDASPLWHAVEGFGVKVHDYLEWNPSKDEENERRSDSKERMRQLRNARNAKGIAPSTTPPVSTNIPRTFDTRLRDVPDRRGEGLVRSFSEEEETLLERAGILREDTYPRLYAKHRHGAKLRLMANAMEFQDALDLVKHWDDARLEKLAVLVLTTDDAFISGTDRSFKIFAMKASWADDKLAAWEAQQANA
jgi:hypothetical protein